jgi:hypothetical protein
MNMDNLQRLIQLAKADGGKFFVIDENANPVLVIMGIDEYENVLIRKMQNQAEDIEDINRQIQEVVLSEEEQKRRQIQDELKSEVIDSTFDFENPQSELEEI